MLNGDDVLNVMFFVSVVVVRLKLMAEMVLVYLSGSSIERALSGSLVEIGGEFFEQIRGEEPFLVMVAIGSIIVGNDGADGSVNDGVIVPALAACP